MKNTFRLRKRIVLSGASILLYATTIFAQPPVAVADGYAEGTTGGAGGQKKVVSSASEFKSACASNEKLIIVVEGDLGKIGIVQAKSNKTLIGKDTHAGYDGNLVLSGVSNIIIQNLTITNKGGVGTGDGIEASMGSTKIFVTKCTFIDCPDGSFDIKRGSDFVTYSWCRYKYPNRSSHNFPNLISHSDGNGGQDKGKLHVTAHHNWYDDGCQSRMPRVRFGTVHVYNNYYGCKGNKYIVGVGKECIIRTESCYFDNVNSAWHDMGGKGNGQMGWKDHKFVNTEVPTFMTNEFPVFEVPYQFFPNNVEDIKDIVTDPEKGAGNVMGSVTAVPLPFGQNPQAPSWMAEYNGSTNIQVFDAAGRRLHPIQSSNIKNLMKTNGLPRGSYFIKPPVSNSGVIQFLNVE